VAEPPPGVRCADWIHDVLAQDLRQRTTPDLERGECQRVDANVVVLVHGAPARCADASATPRDSDSDGPPTCHLR